MRAADAACYMAKDKGRNASTCTSRRYRAVLAPGRNGVGARIQRALEEDRLRLFSQQIVSLRFSSKQDTHCEILLRLLDEDGRLILPARFIPAAERFGLMPLIDRWVVREALQIVAAGLAGPFADA